MAETWVLNESLDPVLQLSKTTISFTSNGQAYAAISFKNRKLVYYTNPYSSSGTSAYVPRGAHGYWANSAYRTVVFDESPSGTLLNWLQRNGTKQVEPEPTTPKHACLIDGTSYSILRGKTLISGTGYDIKNGKVLVDGTVYDIPFTPKAYVVTVTLNGYTDVIYNDTRYSNNTVLYVTPGDSVRCVVSAPLRDGMNDVAVRVNGTKVKTSSFMGPPPYNLPQYSYYYDFTPESDATIVGMDGGSNRRQHGEIDITT